MALPFNAQHLYVQWGGKLPGNEQWSCGFRLRKKSAGSIDSGSGLLAGVSAAILAYHTDSETHISAAAKLSFVKVNAIAIDGTYINEGTNEQVHADVGGAWTGTSIMPNQVALAVSLLTGFSRGPAHRGRFYLPLPRLDLADDGRISEADATSVADQTTVLLDAINTVNADYEMAVFSRKSGAAANRRVTNVAVGRVLDTQRRRRRSLLEDWQ